MMYRNSLFVTSKVIKIQINKKKKHTGGRALYWAISSVNDKGAARGGVWGRGGGKT